MKNQMGTTRKYLTGIGLYQNQKTKRKPNLHLLVLAQELRALDQGSRRE
jgi:hypothetical protein